MKRFEIERLRAENETWQNQGLLEQCNRQADRIEELEAEVTHLTSANKLQNNEIGELRYMQAELEAQIPDPAALRKLVTAARHVISSDANYYPASSKAELETAIKILRGEDMIPYYDEREDAWRCRVCDGNGDIPASKSPVIIGPDTEYTNGDRILCPHCDGSGHD